MNLSVFFISCRSLVRAINIFILLRFSSDVASFRFRGVGVWPACTFSWHKGQSVGPVSFLFQVRLTVTAAKQQSGCDPSPLCPSLSPSPSPPHVPGNLILLRFHLLNTPSTVWHSLPPSLSVSPSAVRPWGFYTRTDQVTFITHVLEYFVCLRGNSLKCPLFPQPDWLGSVVHYLKTVVSYILPAFIVVWGRRVNR